MSTTPETNSAFHSEDENEYQDLSFKAGKPRKLANLLSSFFTPAGYR